VTTPNNHVLIDYENVQPEVASRLAPGIFKVWVFVGTLQYTVSRPAPVQAAGNGVHSVQTCNLTARTLSPFADRTPQNNGVSLNTGASTISHKE